MLIRLWWHIEPLRFTLSFINIECPTITVWCKPCPLFSIIISTSCCDYIAILITAHDFIDSAHIDWFWSGHIPWLMSLVVACLMHIIISRHTANLSTMIATGSNNQFSDDYTMMLIVPFFHLSIVIDSRMGHIAGWLPIAWLALIHKIDLQNDWTTVQGILMLVAVRLYVVLTAWLVVCFIFHRAALDALSC